MHDAGAIAKKDKSNPFIFIPIVVIAIYLLFLVVSIPFRHGIEVGTREAVYYVPPKEGEEKEAEVFDHKKLIKPSEELITLGAKVYDANCKSCHGPEGKGDGPSGINLAKKPRNYHSNDGWLNGKSVVQMYKTLEEGVGVGMAAQPALNPKQKYAVIHYVHATYMTESGFPETTEEEIAALPAVSAGGGEIKIDPYTETRIPIKLAMEKMLEQSGAHNTVPAVEATTKGH